MNDGSESSFATHSAVRVAIHLSQRDNARHGSLMIHLLERARKARLAGATVLHGEEGYGTSGRIHQTHLLTDDAPLTLLIVDQADAVHAFLHSSEDLLENVLVTLSDVDIVEL